LSAGYFSSYFTNYFNVSTGAVVQQNNDAGSARRFRRLTEWELLLEHLALRQARLEKAKELEAKALKKVARRKRAQAKLVEWEPLKPFPKLEQTSSKRERPEVRIESIRARIDAQLAQAEAARQQAQRDIEREVIRISRLKKLIEEESAVQFVVFLEKLDDLEAASEFMQWMMLN
jgi:hypothetical protein